jgi:hypothetical protein
LLAPADPDPEARGAIGFCQMPGRVENGLPQGRAVIASEGSAHVFDFSVMDVDQDGKISEYEFKEG